MGKCHLGIYIMYYAFFYSFFGFSHELSFLYEMIKYEINEYFKPYMVLDWSMNKTFGFGYKMSKTFSLCYE